MTDRRLFDISLPISETLVVWPGDPPVRLSYAAHLERGDPCTFTEIHIGSHTGTHVDAPAHFVPGGPTVDKLDLRTLMGPARVIDLPGAKVIDAVTLTALELDDEDTRLLFKTRNPRMWGQGENRFHKDFVALDETGAQWVVGHGVRLVGIDYLSVATGKSTAVTHRILLDAGVIILEGLDLSNVPAGRYELVCLPLRLEGREGAPARAVLIESR